MRVFDLGKCGLEATGGINTAPNVWLCFYENNLMRVEAQSS